LDLKTKTQMSMVVGAASSVAAASPALRVALSPRVVLQRTVAVAPAVSKTQRTQGCTGGDEGKIPRQAADLGEPHQENVRWWHIRTLAMALGTMTLEGGPLFPGPGRHQHLRRAQLLQSVISNLGLVLRSNLLLLSYKCFLGLLFRGRDGDC